MTVQTGVTDEIKLEDSSNDDVTADLGVITSASHTISQPVDQFRSVGQGLKPVANVDNVAQIEGSVDCQPEDLRALRVFGSESTGGGTYTVTLDDQLPTHTFKQEKVDSGGTVTLKNFKFGSFSLEVSQDNTLSLSMDGEGDDVEVDKTETFSTPSGEFNPRQFFDCIVKIDGSAVGSVESATIDHNRDLKAFKGIEDDAAGEKRLPTAVIPRDFSLSFNMVINIEDNRAYEEALDTTTNPLQVQDTRSNSTVTLEVDTPSGTDTFDLNSSRFGEVSADQENDGEKRTATLTGVAQDGQIDGDT